jgi:hypothetical protein
MSGSAVARAGGVLAAACAVFAVLAGPAAAGQLIDRNATQISLEVNTKEQAMLQYKVGVRHRHVLVWGAVNARNSVAGSNGKPNQVEFKVDYSGGWASFGRVLYPTFKDACRRYTGPAIPYLVVGCDAPDGSYWAVQSWQSELPDLGFTPWLPKQSSWRLKIAHWTGQPAKLDAYAYWTGSGKVHSLFGKFTYAGKPVFGFKTTPYGEPLDTYGRLIYLDTFNSMYGSGWRRENSFVPHAPNGNFCYGFKTYDPHTGGYSAPPGYKGLRGPGNGSRYRLVAVGPGVTPDVATYVKGLGPYDPGDPADVAFEQQQLALSKQIAGSDTSC